MINSKTKDSQESSTGLSATILIPEPKKISPTQSEGLYLHILSFLSAKKDKKEFCSLDYKYKPHL